MLVLARKAKQAIQIANDVKITIVAINGNRVTLGIEAPDDVRIIRTELLLPTGDGTHGVNDSNDSEPKA